MPSWLQGAWEPVADLYSQWQSSGSGSGGNPPSPPPSAGIGGVSYKMLAVVVGAIVLIVLISR